MKGGGIHPAVWRAGQLGHGIARTMASQHPALDAELPGHGWPLGTLAELLGPESGIGEFRLLVPVLRQLTEERRTVFLLGPPLMPYAPALADFGIDLECLVVVDIDDPADCLWAIEQTLRTADFGALLAWLPPKVHALAGWLRRLQLAAQGAAGPVFLFRRLPARLEASPASLRLLLAPLPAEQLAIRILKRRGPPLDRSIVIDLPRPDRTLALRHRPHDASSVRLRSTMPTRPEDLLAAPVPDERDTPRDLEPAHPRSDRHDTARHG